MENKPLQLTDAGKIDLLVDDYYSQIGKGCGPALIDLVSGRNKRRATEISRLTGVGSAEEVTKLFASVNLICAGSKDKEGASQKLREAFLKGTRGGRSTGSPMADKKIENLARLAKRALDKNWEIRERRSRNQ